jgi:hypothetical protein
MYDNLMNKFDFTVTSPHFYVDEDNLRMSSTYRSAFADLVDALLVENKLDSAVAISDRILEMIPDDVIPLNYFSIAMGEAYFQAGMNEKGREVFDRLLANQEEQLDYFFSFPEELRPGVQFETEQCMAIIHAMGQTAGETGQRELQQEIQDKLDFYYDIYLGKQINP